MDGPVVADKLLKVSVFLCIFRTFKFILTSLDELFSSKPVIAIS